MSIEYACDSMAIVTSIVFLLNDDIREIRN